MNPFFSIIIPTYNRASSIGATIDSIISQEFKAVEIIVVDDGSTDETQEVVMGAFASPVLKYFYIPNSERGAARNFGLSKAVGTYINYFDSDDLLLPCLKQLHDFIILKNFQGVFYGGIEHCTSDGGRINEGSPPYKDFTRNLLHNNFLACGSVFIKREIALNFPFNENRTLSSAEDWELWLRMHTKNHFIAFPCAVFRQLHHDKRSLALMDAEKIEKRDLYFLNVFLNHDNISFYSQRLVDLFAADRYTFIALMHSSSNRALAFQYLIKAIHASIQVIKRKRFWAALKKIVLPW